MCTENYVYKVEKVKGKGKGHPRRGHESPEGEKKYSSTLPSASALDGVGVQRHDPAALPPETTRYLLYRRLDGPQGRSEEGRKISPPLGYKVEKYKINLNSIYKSKWQIIIKQMLTLLIRRHPTDGL